MKFIKRWHLNMKNYIFFILIALELLMSFTFLGYIHIAPLSITFAYLPVLVAAYFLDIPQATFIAFLFGLSSMYKASTYYVLPADQVFSPFFSGFPLRSLLLSVGMRTLFGFLMGFFFRLAKKSHRSHLWIIVLGFVASKLHALLVYLALGLFFPDLGYNYGTTFHVSISDIVLCLLCALVMEICWQIAHNHTVQNFCSYVERSSARLHSERPVFLAWSCFIVFTLVTAVAASYYFANRISYMLGAHGITISDNINHDLLHIQTQFLIASFSLNFIMALSLMIIYKYLSYREYLGELDGLTGVMGRKMFLQYCDTLQHKYAHSHQKGCFILVDVDYFKSINDTFGHPMGDTVLKGISEKLRHTFSDYGVVSRFGGDEFAIILEQNISPSDLQNMLDSFLSSISTILSGKQKISCSIGACCFTYPQDMDDIYAETDKLLYQAKQQGRACYVINTPQ